MKALAGCSQFLLGNLDILGGALSRLPAQGIFDNLDRLSTALNHTVTDPATYKPYSSHDDATTFYWSTPEPLELLWYPTAPDGRARRGTADGALKKDHDYHRRSNARFDRHAFGFSGALLATGPHDVHVLAVAMIAHTGADALPDGRPPRRFSSPMLAAKMAVTLDQFSRGRVLLNIVNGDSRTLESTGLDAPTTSATPTPRRVDPRLPSRCRRR